MPSKRRDSCETALTESRRARRSGDYKTAWAQLERAHVLGQPFIGPHLRTHLEMLQIAVMTRIPREALAKSSGSRSWFPAQCSDGCPSATGRANVSAFAPMPISDELRALL